MLTNDKNITPVVVTHEDELKKILISMCNTYPNDGELGTRIRKLIDKLNK
jgi:hypothetical protein